MQQSMGPDLTVSPKSITPSGTAVKFAAERTKRDDEVTLRRTILKVCCTLLAASSVWGSWSCTAKAHLKWIAFYGQTADEHALSSYDIVILDPAFQGSVTGIAKTGARVCAYLSLGEVRTSDPLYNQVDRSALFGENNDWPGTFRIDIRYRSWKALVLEKLIPDIYSKGFTGLLLDTLDTPSYLEGLDPDGNRGMGQAAAELVREVRKSFPNLLVFMNRGYALLPSVTDCIDGVVAESLLTTFIPGENGGYGWNQPSEVAHQLSLLSPVMHLHTPLPVLSLDYWDAGDPGTIKEIYARERALGCHPYVATRMLDSIIPEPAG